MINSLLNRYIIIVMTLLSLVVGNVPALAQDPSAGELPSLRDFYRLSPSWSPDGKSVIYTVGRELHLRSPQADATSDTTLVESADITAFAWNPDSSNFVTGYSDGAIIVRNVATLEIILQFSHSNTPVIYLAWSPNGKNIVGSLSLNGETTALHSWDAQSGNLLNINPQAGGLTLSFSPDGQFIAASGGGDGIALFDANTLEIQHVLYDTSEALLQVYPVTWSLDGAKVVTGSINGLVDVWDIMNQQNLFSFIGSPNYKPDPNRPFAGVPFDQLPLTWIKSVTFTPDGQKVLSASGDGTITMWDLNSQQTLATYQAESIGAAAWSAYGAQLAILPPRPLPTSENQNLATAENNDSLQVIVPFASKQQLNELAASCGMSLTANQTDSKASLEAFVQQVESQSSSQLPTGCASDLIAMANAISDSTAP